MRIYTKIRDDRITVTLTADFLARETNSLITVIQYGAWKKAVYLMGRRVYKNEL